MVGLWSSANTPNNLLNKSSQGLRGIVIKLIRRRRRRRKCTDTRNRARDGIACDGNFRRKIVFCLRMFTHARTLELTYSAASTVPSTLSAAKLPVIPRWKEGCGARSSSSHSCRACSSQGGTSVWNQIRRVLKASSRAPLKASSRAPREVAAPTTLIECYVQV